MAEASILPVAAGRLLVASPALLDPNFDHTVVLLLDVDDDGALGVVLNRPSEVPVAEVVSPWSPLTTRPDVVFRGGPVGTDSALALARLDGPDAPPAAGFRPLFEHGDAVTGIVDLDAPPQALAPALTGVRVFAGYAGWASQQLEVEIDEGAWYVVSGRPGDAFGPQPDGLWRSVLRRQPGELAWVSTRPEDPSQN